MLLETVHGRPLVYLDTAATALKPKRVVEKMAEHDLLRTSNVHRGIHFFSDQATQEFEAARCKVASFIGAEQNQIAFTHGTTESLNILAHGLESLIQAGDQILLTELEHHSNIVPWQMVASRTGAQIVWVSVSDNGELDEASYSRLLSSKTKVAAFSGLSNTLGTKLPIRKMIREAQNFGAITVVDAAQLVTNQKINVQDLGCDFLCFSGHKLFGPTGVGVLYGKTERLSQLPPLFGGGSMISQVTFEGSTFLEPPFRFEAGTPHITGAIGLGEAIDFVEQLGMDQIEAHESLLLKRATEGLKLVKGVKVIGEASSKGPILSFVVEGLHHQDIGSVLDQQGIAVRCGHHCTQPLLSKFGLTGTVRASFSVYNSVQDVDKFVEAVEKARKVLG